MFVRGGGTYPGSYPDRAGRDSSYWSSVGYNSNNAYYLYFDSGLVYPSVSNYRYGGFSVRCVALGG